MQKILDRKIKFALMGCSRISKNHIQALNSLGKDCELIAACDNNPEALKQYTEDYNITGYTSLSEMLRNVSADLIIVTTPNGLHAENTIDSLRAGFNVITEKPMATNLEDARKMIKVSEETSKTLFVVKQLRYQGRIRALKTAIDEGRLGKIFTCNVNVFWSRPQSYFNESPWRGTKDMDGGIFLNQASHHFDLLYWLLGPVQTVYSLTKKLQRDIEVEDTGSVLLEFVSDTIASINVSILTYPANIESSITILGEKGTVKIGGKSLNEVQVELFQDNEKLTSLSEEKLDALGKHEDFYNAVVDSFRDGKLRTVDGKEAFQSLEIIMAAYKASEDRTPITLQY